VTQVGTATLVAPAPTADAVWLTSYPPGVNMTTAAGQPGSPVPQGR